MTTQDQHSAIVGGSTAARLIACPGSWRLNESLPVEVEVPSVYAEEGTALHEVMYALVDATLQEPKDCVGYIANNGVEITRKHIDECIAPAWRMVQGFWPKRGEYDSVLEERVEFPGIEGAFGTVDNAMKVGKKLILIDYKFGQGVPVAAQNNAQLLYYACALRHTLPELFDGVRYIDLVIIQPRLLAEPSVFHTTTRQLNAFEKELQKVVALARGPNPPLAKGEQCRFCKAKVVCPLWTQQLETLAGLLDTVTGTPHKFAPPDYGALLGRALDLATHAERFIAEARQQAHAMLEAGQPVNGWKLVPKRAIRRWLDEESAATALMDAGFTDQVIYKEVMNSPAAIEKAGKENCLEIPEGLITAVSNGSTLASAGDPRSEHQSLEAALTEFAELADEYVTTQNRDHT